jgi:hypothetical protein
MLKRWQGGGIACCNETQAYAGGKEASGKVTQAGKVSVKEPDQASLQRRSKEGSLGVRKSR